MDMSNKILNRLKKKLFSSNKKPKPNKKAIWVFGMQKSGTSVIAGLLAHRLGYSVTLDTEMLWNPYLQDIKDNKLDFVEHIFNYPEDFSKQIIKEPTASLIINHVEKFFHLDKYVFIYRNPFDVIRSILNRLEIRGDMDDVDINSINHNWQYIFVDGKDYIKRLASIWLNVYSQDKYISNDKCLFVSYELFMNNKVDFIDKLCHKLKLKKKNSIIHLLDKDFQPRGNTNVDIKAFFGEKNYQIITDICSKKAEELESKFSFKTN